MARFGDGMGNGKMYRVPSCQRNDSWREKPWEDLGTLPTHPDARAQRAVSIGQSDLAP
ncbi:MAG: hypothetical protein ACUVSQ_01065 [Pseudanabaenaceae cyanobacterium]